MCMAIPGEILSRDGFDATVDFGGTRQNVRLDLLPEARVGDKVLVHVGYAIQVVDEQAAQETLELLREYFGIEETGGAR